MPWIRALGGNTVGAIRAGTEAAVLGSRIGLPGAGAGANKKKSEKSKTHSFFH